MKNARFFLFFLFFALGAFSGALLDFPSPSPAPAPSSSVTPLFFPGSEPEVRRLVDSANQSVYVTMYVFTYEPLAWSLIDAVERGVEVKVILEPRLIGSSNPNLSMKELLEAHGVDVRWASLSYPRTHSKTIVVDSKRVIVGSTNWSSHAMLLNREDALLVADAKLASVFEEQFFEDWGKAV